MAGEKCNHMLALMASVEAAGVCGKTGGARMVPPKTPGREFEPICYVGCEVRAHTANAGLGVAVLWTLKWLVERELVSQKHTRNSW